MRSRGTKEQVLIDKVQVIFKDYKNRHTNLAMTWVDYRKAYDMLPRSWIVDKVEWKKYNHGCEHMGSCNSIV